MPSADNPIWDLEKLKDRILALLQSGGLEDDVRQMWCGDAKEMYYTVVLAHSMASPGRDPAGVHAILQAASSRYEQVASELRSLGSPGRKEKTSRARLVFSKGFTLGG